jgi:DNA-binding NarL/FixJ family response regulator
VIGDGRNGRLVNFFDVHAMAERVLEMLRARGEQVTLRRQAREDVQQYSRERGLAGYDGLLGLGDGEPTRRSEPLTLSERDRELLRWLSAGHSNAQIAELRRRSPATVRNQVCALYEKLGVSKRVEAVAIAAAMNLLWRDIVTSGGGS